MQIKMVVAKATTIFYGGDTQNRTGESEFCRLVPYRLAMSPHKSH